MRISVFFGLAATAAAGFAVAMAAAAVFFGALAAKDQIEQRADRVRGTARNAVGGVADFFMQVLRCSCGFAPAHVSFLSCGSVIFVEQADDDAIGGFHLSGQCRAVLRGIQAVEREAFAACQWLEA